jgi:hypothetical protein
MVHTLARNLEAYERRGELAAAHYRATVETRAARARTAVLDGVAERAVVSDVAFLRALRAVYRDPEHARRLFFAAAEREPERAAYLMRERPDRFGQLVTDQRPVLLGLLSRPDDRRARAAAREAAGHGREAIEARRQLHEVTATMRARRLESELAAQLGSIERFTTALGALYRNPTEAQLAFEYLAVRHGVAHTADTMRQYPWLFGALRDSRTPGEMQREAADRVATLGVEAMRASQDLPPAELRLARAVGQAPDVASERTAALIAVDRAATREAQLAADLQRLPDRRTLGRQIAAAMQRLTPNELRELQQMVTAPRLALATKLRETTRELALGDDGRER